MIIILICCAVDDGLGKIGKERNARLYPSKVVTIGLLVASKGGPFYRWLKRDYGALFAALPERSALPRQLGEQAHHADRLLAEPSLLKVIDSFPRALLFPIRQGRSARQFGKKSRDRERWSVGLKLCWILNHLGVVVGWHWLPMNHHDQYFLPLVRLVKELNR